MVKKGFAYRERYNGDYGLIISNGNLYQIIKSVPLTDFTEKQHSSNIKPTSQDFQIQNSKNSFNS